MRGNGQDTRFAAIKIYQPPSRTGNRKVVTHSMRVQFTESPGTRMLHRYVSAVIFKVCTQVLYFWICDLYLLEITPLMNLLHCQGKEIRECESLSWISSNVVPHLVKPQVCPCDHCTYAIGVRAQGSCVYSKIGWGTLLKALRSGQIMTMNILRKVRHPIIVVLFRLTVEGHQGDVTAYDIAHVQSRGKEQENGWSKAALNR